MSGTSKTASGGASARQRVVTQQEWTDARKALLAKEKAFSRERDALSAARRELPMVKVDKPYAFDAPDGRRTLADLFDGERQLIVYHFMFGPTWDEGCKSCSFLGDHFDGAIPHLRARDTSFVVVSRAPLAKLEAFKQRMGWKFDWVSSSPSDFNDDYGVTFREGETATYNYETGPARMTEAPGLSAFLREGDDVFHTYSTYARGLDTLLGAYNLLDLTALGRHEEGLKYGMEWVRHHDKYVAT